MARSRPPGSVALRRRLREVGAAVAAGRPAVAVFDLDNTLFDTRYRTLAVARDFDRRRGASWFSGLRVADVRVNGEATARARGLRSAEVAEFAGFWRREFWRPARLTHDRPLERVLRWVREAAAVGARPVFLTGRTRRYREASVAQLERAGLEVAPRDVHCKPDVGTPTAGFKVARLRRWRRRAEVAWFLTENRRVVAAVRHALPDLQVVCLDCSFEEGVAPIPEGVPVLPRCF